MAKKKPAKKTKEQSKRDENQVAAAMNNLANVTAMSVIAKSGTDEDRMIAIAYLKRRFKEFRD